MLFCGLMEFNYTPFHELKSTVQAWRTDLLSNENIIKPSVGLTFEIKLLLIIVPPYFIKEELTAIGLFLLSD